MLVDGRDGVIAATSSGGSPVEMKYALLNFGVPAESLPFDELGRLVDGEFRVQMAKRKEWEKQTREQQTSSVPGLIESTPSRFDVLLGQGRLYQDFPGNIRLTQLVELRYATYEAATVSEKTEIAIEIVHAIQDMGGRFLTQKQAESDDKSNTKLSGDSDTGGGSGSNCDNVGKKKAANDVKQQPSSYSSSSWVEVGFKTAHRKVSIAFQTRKRRKS